MESVNLASSNLALETVIAPSPDSAALQTTVPSTIPTSRFDGLEWTYREGFRGALESVPAAVWADPHKQGWRRVKHNGSRDVWRASIDGHVYFLKYYTRARWTDALKGLLRASPCHAEWNGGLYALRAGIPAVVPEGFAAKLVREGRRCSLLVTAGVEPSYPLNEFWETLCNDGNVDRRREDTDRLLDLLAQMIARAHQAGFEHLDMHAANILVQPLGDRRYQTLLVDLHSARLGVPVRDGAVVRNLAQLNQWFRRHSSIGDRLRFLRAYFRWRNEYEHAFEHARPLGLSYDELVRALVHAADRHARRLWAQRDRRLGRDGRYFSRIRLGGGWRGMVFTRAKQPSPLSRASELEFRLDWWRGQLDRPLRFFSQAGDESCKESHSALVRRAVLDRDGAGIPVILKRPLARDRRRALSRMLAPSRSLRGWRMGHALLHRDIETARPLAALERRIGPFVRDSVLITEGVPGAVDLESHLRRQHAKLSPADWRAEKRLLCELLVRQLRRLQERGFAHRDCKASNLLVASHPRPTLLWIDMDGLRLPRRLSSRQRLEPLMRLHVSLLDLPGLTRTDRLRFLKAFCAKFGADPRAWRSTWRKISAATKKKVRAQRKRRGWKLAHYGRE